MKDVQNLDEYLAADKPLLVDFWAEWCGPCHKIGQVLSVIEEETDDINIVKVNIDKAQELTDKYNIYALPTLVFFKEGKEVTRKTGVQTKDHLLETIKNI